MSERTIGWRQVMGARDPGEPHRASTPLELLFDLCFVVAVAQAAAGLHHAVAENHVGSGLVGYVMVFFAIWWAWMNFTWFASAYDTDDAPYRLLTLLQMGGVLILAAGVHAALTHYDFRVITVGYLVMRVAMIGQWLRAAAEHREGRRTALRYAAGIAVVQVGWLARLALPHPFDYVGFVVLAVAEMSVPAYAEFRGGNTSWHPEHIAERYGGFTIIVLGEVILASLTGLQSALSEHGVSPALLLTATGALILVFSLWWIYFGTANPTFGSIRTALTWGYTHSLVFAAVAAVGAGLEVAIGALEHEARVPTDTAALAVAVPVALYLLLVALLHRLTNTGAVAHVGLVIGGVVVVLLIAFTSRLWGVDSAVLAIGLATAATLAINVTINHRKAHAVASGT